MQHITVQTVGTGSKGESWSSGSSLAKQMLNLEVYPNNSVELHTVTAMDKDRGFVKRTVI
jgi:hypothetical protein